MSRRMGVVLMTFSLWATVAHADINGDLNQFFNRLGYAHDATSPTAYQGQEAGYYTGGSLFLRNSVQNAQLAEMTLPSVNAGCGGIDLYMGGFSFINSQGIKTLMQSILHGATGYVTELALEQALPEETNVMKHMQDIANRVNQFNINACHAAAQLVGALSSKTEESQIHICESAALSEGRVKSWTAAQQACRNPHQFHAIMAQASQPGNPYHALVVTNTNLAWKAIQRNAFLNSDPQLAELLMTLSGSIITTESGGVRHYQTVPSLATNGNLIKALLDGGPAPIYRCDTLSANGCLHPTAGTVQIAESAGLRSHVAKLLTDMVNDIETNTPLKPEAIGLLQATRIPVYKMLNVQAAYLGDRSIVDVSHYADVIATDILFQYLEENLKTVEASTAAMQYPPAIMARFQNAVHRALTQVEQQQSLAYKKVQMVDQLVVRTQMIERMLAGELSSQLMDNLQWSRGAE